MNIGHFHIQSGNFEKSIAFYTGFMGFKELARQEGTAYLRDDNGFDFLIDDVSGSEPIPPSVHIGFRRETPGDVKACFEALADKVEMIGDLSEEEGFTVFTCKDPDQMQIEVFYSAL